jgi:regulatory protein
MMNRMAFRKKRRSLDSVQAADALGARSAAQALLARRDFASGELSKKLELQGFDAVTAAAVIDELIDEHYLDDARYAKNFVNYHADRGHGPFRITSELKVFGIPAELIEAALAAGPDWHVLAREVKNRKFGPDEASDWAERARQARFLQYRGFSSDHIRLALGADLDPDGPP